MSRDEPLSDNQAHDLLTEARRSLGEASGATIRANTALEAARRVLSGLAASLLIASEADSDELPGVRDRNEP
jgi:hypothetical protein